MKKILICLIFLFIFTPLTVKGFETSASAAILMDMDSGRILYSKQIHLRRSVASISKIMTAILAIESGNLETIITVGDEINDAYGSGIYIKKGEQIKLKDLLYGLMLRSGNDAALAIANYVGGNVDSFVNMMNEKAKQIGMKNSEFNNPSGLDEDEGNYSTAYDMAILTSYAMKNDIYQSIVSTKKHKVKTNLNYYEWTNKNKLLFTYNYLTGGKTGFTEIAKRTLVTTASKNDLNLVVVTLNDGNDFADHKSLYDEAFSVFSNYKILQSGSINIPGETYYKRDTLFLNNDFTYPFLDSELSQVTIKYSLNKLREYSDNQVVGKAEVYINKELVNTSEIYVTTNKNKEQKNIFEKILDWIKSLW
ncbi:MAG: D-alanyl-D-alanine carboxypeptidase [Firmicutes bacterium]|nr:D-alanyl-D-alanine carboxypeptidase [Bacillota bacterium]